MLLVFSILGSNEIEIESLFLLVYTVLSKSVPNFLTGVPFRIDKFSMCLFARCSSLPINRTYNLNEFIFLVYGSSFLTG